MKLTFKDFLKESTYLQADDISPEEAAEMIKERGKEWEKIIGGYATNNLNWIVYRGMKERFSPDICVKYPRSSRRPLTTNKKVHELADDYFKHKFGTKFRSESIFVSRSAELAQSYGDVYVVFPLDRVSFCWSTKVEDFTVTSAKYNKMFGDGDVTLTKDDFKEFQKFMDDLDYHCDDDSLKNDFIKYRNFKQYEVMIKCDEYLAIREEALHKVLDHLLA